MSRHFRRTIRILTAHFAACFVIATTVNVVMQYNYWIISESISISGSEATVYYLNPSSTLLPSLLAILLSTGVLMASVIVIAEYRSLRNLWIYLLAAALLFQAIAYFTHAFAAALAAGLEYGFVYWLIAGRHAGEWKRPVA